MSHIWTQEQQSSSSLSPFIASRLTFCSSSGCFDHQILLSLSPLFHTTNSAYLSVHQETMIGALAIKNRRQLQLQKSLSSCSTGGDIPVPQPQQQPPPASSSSCPATAVTARPRTRHCSVLYIVSGTIFVSGFVMILPAIMERDQKYFYFLAKQQ